MRYPQFIFVLAGLLLAALDASAAGVKVIANSSVAASSISADDLRSVFLEARNSLSDGTHVQPVLKRGGTVHTAFVRDYLDKSDAALQIYYRSLVFTGKGSMPKEVSSDAEVVSYVSRTKGAIGYVSSESESAGTKTLEIK